MTALHIIFLIIFALGIYLTFTDADPKGARRTVWVIIWTLAVIQIFIPALLTQ